MNRKQKREFIRQLTKSVMYGVLQNVDRMPETWDGHELRRYLADAFETNCTLGRTKHAYRARFKAYRNDVLIGGL